eukprot:TRINITY_DN2351_c0_g1_i3.p1 TRINITY_DN2351_c0_g1~~TRINITY_DN2351_c0_g1_i3.p1  ORF type:complete len:205 (-),score=18.72 TRINITY_DN2351_c0_g1_i3:46-660(-)
MYMQSQLQYKELTVDDQQVQVFFFFSSRRRHTRCREVSWARRCVQETGINAEYMGNKMMEIEIDQKKEKIKRGCKFCDILDTDKILYETPYVVAFADRKPRGKMHFLVIPKIHIVSIIYLTPEHISLVHHMLEVGKVILETYAHGEEWEQNLSQMQIWISCSSKNQCKAPASPLHRPSLSSTEASSQRIWTHTALRSVGVFIQK